MLGLIIGGVITTLIGASVYKNKDLSVKVMGDSIEIRFKYKERQKFYDTIAFVKGLPGGADFRNLGGEKYWVVPNKKGTVKLLEDWGFPIYRVAGKSAVAFDRKEYHKIAPWKNIEITQDPNLYDDKVAWDYQIESLRFLKYNNGRGIIGHEMSVGKTMIGLMFLKENFLENTPVLIVCKAILKSQWEEEFFSVFKRKIHVIYGRTLYKIPPGTNCVINYDILKDWEGTLSRVGFETMIADEFHCCGNMQTLRTKSYRRLAKQIPNLIPLSGTSIRTKPSQLFPTLNLIKPEIFPSVTQFQDRYSMFKTNNFTGYREETKGCRNEAELQDILKDIMFRKERTDPDVEKSMGIKGNRGVRIPVHIKIDTKDYDAQFAAVANKLKVSSAIVRRQINTDLSRTAFEGKKAECVKWIADFLETGEKLVVFCWHCDVMDYICEAFPKDSVKIDGSVTGNARTKAAEAFKGDTQLGVFQIGAMGEGVDWIAPVCRTGAFVELPSSAAEVEQAEMRFDRSSSSWNKMFLYFLLAKGTIDEKKMIELDKGKQAFDQVVRGKSSSDSGDLLENLFKK